MSILKPKLGNFVFTILSLWIIASGVFLIFGPPEGVFPLGILYFFLGCMGFFGSTTGNETLMTFFVFFGIIVWLIAVGANALFISAGSGRVESITTGGCNTAFGVQFGGKSLDRCKDDGFLNYLRFVAILNQFVLSAAFVVAILNYAAPDLLQDGSAPQDQPRPAEADAPSSVAPAPQEGETVQ